MASGLAIGLEQIDPQIGRGRTVESRHLAFQALAEDPLQMRLEPFRQVIGDCAGHLRVAQGPADKADGRFQTHDTVDRSGAGHRPVGFGADRHAYEPCGDGSA